MMRQAVLLAVTRSDVNLIYEAALSEQREIEERFAMSMGDMLIDGYYSNTSYAPGQEELLYREASEVMAHLSKPSVSYMVSVQNLSGISGYEQERFTVNMALRIWDEALSLNDIAYVTKLEENPESPEKDSVTISNDLTSIGGVTLDGIISRITGIAEVLNRKKALYDRTKAISADGSIPAKRLEGMIDVLKTRLNSSISNWYTDENGNLILESLDGRSAMKLCGDGFMIAGGRTDEGAWDWRTFGTGKGFAADMLVTGFLSAERIQAHTITANKLAADVGESLDLSSNTSVNLTVKQTVADEVKGLTIGGTNLIPNTSGDYAQLELGQYYALIGERMEVASFGLAPGEVVTCSMVLKNSASKASCSQVATYSDESGDDGKTVFTSTEVIPAGGEGRSSLTITLPAGATHLEIMVQNSTPIESDADTMSVKCVKLERGDIATDWSPAPGDIANRMELRLTEAYAQINSSADGIRQEVRANYAELTDLGNLSQQLSTLSEQSEDHFTWATTKITEICDDVAGNQTLADERFALIKTYMAFGENG